MKTRIYVRKNPDNPKIYEVRRGKRLESNHMSKKAAEKAAESLRKKRDRKVACSTAGRKLKTKGTSQAGKKLRSCR